MQLEVIKGIEFEQLRNELKINMRLGVYQQEGYAPFPAQTRASRLLPRKREAQPRLMKERCSERLAFPLIGGHSQKTTPA